MLESRAAYGYYGEGHGATGETCKKTHASGWSIYEYRFQIAGLERFGIKDFRVNARNYANAFRAAKKWAKENGCAIVGDAEGRENQTNWNS